MFVDPGADPVEPPLTGGVTDGVTPGVVFGTETFMIFAMPTTCACEHFFRSL